MIELLFYTYRSEICEIPNNDKVKPFSTNHNMYWEVREVLS